MALAAGVLALAVGLALLRSRDLDAHGVPRTELRVMLSLGFLVARFSGAALTEGVEHHTVRGVPVRVYGVAKTVADLFKYRNNQLGWRAASAPARHPRPDRKPMGTGR